MAKSLLPVGIQASLAQGQNSGTEIRKMPVGQDEKAAVIDDQFEAVILQAKVPPDPAISGRALQGGGGKTHQGDPVIVPGGDVPEGLADLG